jgi:hypothetical protein
MIGAAAAAPMSRGARQRSREKSKHFLLHRYCIGLLNPSSLLLTCLYLSVQNQNYAAMTVGVFRCCLRRHTVQVARRLLAPPPAEE